MIVCEDIENEDDYNDEADDVTLSYDHINEKSKLERIKQLAAPHALM